MQGVTAILLMGGVGERFGSALPKQFHRLSGKKIYIHTLERLAHSRLFEEILLVAPEKWIGEVKADLSGWDRAPVRVVVGGKTRQESSYRGLLACRPSTTIVLIHDAVRPFVSERILRENVEAAAEYGAANTCIPSADTIVHSKEGVWIDQIPTRREYLRGQTPQSFQLPLILQAHATTPLRDASDDCSLLIDAIHPIHIVKGEECNIKVTSELDLFLADQMLRLDGQGVPASTHSLKGKLYAVAGGTGGIGSALIRQLKTEGAETLALARSGADYCCDLSSAEQTAHAFEQIARERGPLDGLINSIGVLQRKQVLESSSQEIDEQIAVNLLGPIYSCRFAQIKRGGHIVNVASSSYSRGRSGYALYAAAKAALVNFTQGFAEENPELCVNALIPGRTDTKMRRTHFPDAENVGLLQPERVASSIVDLLKQERITSALVKV